MELFFTTEMVSGTAVLRDDEYRHCCKVLRHGEGDIINVIDGSGTLYECRIVNVTSSAAEAEVVRKTAGFGAHGYNLVMAVAPTKNIDRYEWFIEKAVEMGVDECVPLVCARSERRIVKTDRLKRVALSAAKQSLKGKLPSVPEASEFRDFIMSCPDRGLKAIAYCGDEYEKQDISEFISGNGDIFFDEGLTVLIGPEGDFSESEVRNAVEAGFVPVSLGASRLRTETAALLAVSAAYLYYSRNR